MFICRKKIVSIEVCTLLYMLKFPLDSKEKCDSISLWKYFFDGFTIIYEQLIIKKQFILLKFECKKVLFFWWLENRGHFLKAR